MSRTQWPVLILRSDLVSAATFDAVNSTYTQAGPVPGVCATTNGSKMRLEAGGDANGDTLQALGTRGGMPGVDGAGVCTRADGDSAWNGHDLPTSLHKVESVEYDVAGTIKHLCAVRASWGVVAVAEYDGRYVYAWTRETGAFGGAFGSAVEVFDNGSAYTQGAFPCLAYDPVEDRVYCWWVVELVAGTYATVRGAYTEDGTTWTTFQRAALRSRIDLSVYDLQRLRAGWHEGRVLLVAWAVDATLTYPDTLIQWASADGGRNFDAIDTWSGDDLTAHAGYPDVVVDNGIFRLVYIRHAAGGSGYGLPYLKSIGSPYEPLSAAGATLCQGAGNAMRWATIDVSNTFTAGDLALSMDENGNLYVTGRDLADDNQCFTYLSQDGGQTWLDDTLGGSDAAGAGPCWYNAAEPTRHPRAFAAAWSDGAMIVVGTAASASGIGEASLFAYELGGWTRMEMPLEYDGARAITRASWERVWTAIDTPDDATGGLFALAATGTPTITLQYGTLLVEQDVAEATEYSTVTAPPGGLENGVMAEIGWYHYDGLPYLEVRAGEAGPSSYAVRVRWTGGDLEVEDRVANVIKGTVTPEDSHVEIRVHVFNAAGAPADDGKVTVWYRTPSVLDGDTGWQLLGSWDDLEKGASTTSRVLWGCEVGTADVEFDHVYWTSDVHVGVGWYGASYPASLQGRDITSRLMDTSEAMQIKAVSGWCDRGDQWACETAYLHGVANLYTEDEPSPSTTYRTTSDATALTLQWVTADLDLLGRGLIRSLGVWIGACNVQTLEIWCRNSAGTWAKHADVDTAEGQSGFTYLREGNVFRPDPTVSQAGAYHYAANELAGAHVAIGTGASRKVLRIVSNTEGAWYGPGSIQRCDIVVEGLDGTEPTSGADLAILSKELAVLIHDVPILSGFRIVIPVQETSEGYFELKLLVGDVVLFARPYSASRDRGYEPQTDLSTSPGGGRRARVRSRRRRYVEFGGEDLFPLHGAYGAAPAPRATPLYTGGRGIGSVDDTPYTVIGVLERLQGAKEVCAYLSAVPLVASGSDEVVLVQSRSMMLCRLTSESVVVSTARGDEANNEVVRFGRLRWEEEL